MELLKHATVRSALSGMLAIVLVSACHGQEQSRATPSGGSETAQPDRAETAMVEVEEATSTPFIREFHSGHDDASWYISDFSYTSPTQATAWESDHTTFDARGMQLRITREPSKGLDFTGAEIRTRDVFHYGRYEVVMKAAAGSGLVSSFFTYISPPHDEIDIEFMGDDTQAVQFNSYYEGEKSGFAEIRLPYDAAEVFQLYAFEWDIDEIRWYIGDQLVHTKTREMGGIPTTPAQIMMNLWTSGDALADWHGVPSFESGANARYKCASYKRFGGETSQCSDRYSFDLPAID